MRGKTFQPKKRTPARGTALARTRAETDSSSRPRRGWPIRDSGARRLRVRPLLHREREPGGVLPGVVDLVVGDDAGRLVVVLPAGVQVAVEPDRKSTRLNSSH